VSPDPGSLLPVAFQAAEIAADLMRTRRPASLTEKHDRDLVSDVDLAIERQIRAHLADATPGIGFLGEEEGRSGSHTSGWLWTLDPIDGTSNYAHGIPLCAASLALLHDGRPVLAVIDAPFLGQRYHAVEGHGAYASDTRLSVSATGQLRDAIIAVGDYATGPSAGHKNEQRLAVTVHLTPRVHRIRMLGTAALDLAWVAAGQLDASITLANDPWDTAAGVLLVREAGGTVVDTDGNNHAFDSAATIAGPHTLISQLLPLLQATQPDSNDQPNGLGDHPSPYAALDAILSHTHCLIFDFDGPISDLSAAMPVDTAERLRELAATETTDTPPLHAGEGGPLGVLASAARISPELAAKLNDELTGIELTAVTTATTAGYVHDTLAACRDSARTSAVISRHSIQAVHSHLARLGLAEQIAHVIAPGSFPPGHLRTHAQLLQEAIHALDAAPATCALITASPAGIEAAHAAGIHPIGYAASPSIRELLADAGAACIIPSLADLTLRLRARPLPN
jgi:myo-inositol-1(or 4)-monophosphatase